MTDASSEPTASDARTDHLTVRVLTVVKAAGAAKAGGHAHRVAVLCAAARDSVGEERIALVEEIWDSIAAGSAAVPLTTPQRDELDRRLADHASYPTDVVSWDEVKASLDERLKK
jgi:putative addiction module component (TIGR02574 family)